MKKFLGFISISGLVLMVLPSFLVFGQILTWEAHANLMIAGTILWFLAAPFWMKKTDGV